MFTKSIAAQRPFKLALIASFALVAAAVSAPSLAADAGASANVMIPIAIAKGTDMAFGRFASGSAGGTVTINTLGARDKTGDVVLAGGTPGAATFTVTGEPSVGYAITLPATATLTGAGGGTMVLTLASDTTAAGITSGQAASGTLSGTGTQTLYVGGSLAVAAGQTAGAYTGIFSATVAYQ
jgi:hypothetical protein